MRLLIWPFTWLLWAAGVQAGTQSYVESLDLRQTVINVLEKNPVLKSNDLEAQAAAARIRQSSLSTPYRVQLDLENIAGSDRYEGIDAMESTVSLIRILESGNKSHHRGQVATQQANLLDNELAAQRLDLLSEAARRFIHAALDQQRLQIAKEKLALINRTASIVDKRIRAGRSPDSERGRVVISKTRAEIELEHAEHELLTSMLRLSTLWGVDSPAPYQLTFPLFTLDDIREFSQLVSLLENNPDLVRFATQQRLADARLRLARSQQRPDIELAAGIRHFNTSDDGALVFSANIPLGSNTRARHGVQEALILASKEPLLYEQRRLELHALLFENYQEILHAKTAYQAFTSIIIPEAERVLEDYEKGYRLGRYSLLELSEAQRDLLEARLEILDNIARFHHNRIEIERLTGMAISTGAPQ